MWPFRKADVIIEYGLGYYRLPLRVDAVGRPYVLVRGSLRMLEAGGRCISDRNHWVPLSDKAATVFRGEAAS